MHFHMSPEIVSAPEPGVAVRADIRALASVRSHVADEAVLDLELSAAGGALVLLVVAAAPLLAVLPTLRALEGLATVRTGKRIEFNKV